MNHQGQRSQKSLRRRFARRIVLATSFHDEEMAETISRVDLNYIDPQAAKYAKIHVEHGEVLIDKRARGTFQIMN